MVQKRRRVAAAQHHLPAPAAANEIHSPTQARCIGIGQQTFGKAAAQPQGVEAAATDLAGIERGQFQVADASGQRFAGLLQQIDRRRAQHEKAAPALPAPPAGVDEPAQALEKARYALDLIEDDELVRVLRQVEFRLGELGAVRLGLEIQVDRRSRPRDLERQCGLAGLPRPEQRHGRRFAQSGDERGLESARNHPCNYGASIPYCKVKTGSP